MCAPRNLNRGAAPWRLRFAQSSMLIPARSARSCSPCLGARSRRQRERRPVGALPHRPARRLSRHPGPEVLGAQGAQYPQQGPPGRPGGRQDRCPRRHERTQPTQGLERRTALRRSLEAPLPQGRRLACLRNDLDDLLTCFRYNTLAERKQVRTTNAIERRFREVRRRTRPMGTFQDRTSMDRILYAVFIHENKSQGISTPVSLTHNS